MQKSFYNIKLFKKEAEYIMNLLEKDKNVYSEIILKNIESQIKK